MAVPADYWSAADLDALATGGLINESVMSKIWNISNIPLPFMDAVGVGEPITATPHSWTTDAQAAVDLTNAVIDGDDATGNQAAGGTRVQNHCQISDKVVSVSERAIASDTIGRANEYAYQISMRQRDLRRDIEAISLMPQASVADTGDAAAGKSAGFPGWLSSHEQVGTGGAVAGYQSGTGLVTVPTPGDTRVFLVSRLRTAVESVYLSNGNPSLFMSRPEVTSRLNLYILANPTAFGIATPTANISGSGGGVDQTAQGFVSVLVTDFGTTLKMVPNRLQQVYDSGDTTPVDTSDCFLIDTGQVEFTYLIPEHSNPLAKLGTTDRAQISTQWSLRVPLEAAHAVIRDITPTGTVAA